MTWKVGDKRSIVRTITQADIAAFAAVSGDNQRLHLDESFAQTTRFGGVVAHGMLSGAIFSAVLGTQIPGEGAILVCMGPLRFHAAIRPGDEITYTGEITAIGERGRMTVYLSATNSIGTVVCDGTSEVVYR